MRLQVKKKGRNHGRWFWTCQRPRGAQCQFFKWDDDPPPSQESSSAPSSIITTIGQGSPPLPDLTPTRRPPGQFSSTPTAARAHIPRNSIIQTHTPGRPEASSGLFIDGNDDSSNLLNTLFSSEELGLDFDLRQATPTPPSRKRVKMEDDDDNHNSNSRSSIQDDLFGDLNSDEERQMREMADQSQTTTQKLSQLEREEAAIAAIAGTPSTPARQWPAILGGLPTPTTGNGPPADGRDPPAKRLKTAENHLSSAPPSSIRGPVEVSSQGEPGSSQQQLSQRDGEDYEITTQILRLLAGQMIPVPVRGAIRETLNTYALRARGVERGREMARTALQARNAKIADLQSQNAILQERIKRITAGIEALYQEGNTTGTTA